ncbi:MAG: hypothetical protein BECKG1743D_GA0114223_111721, partial [Candidatus Kentron sp. G]
MKEVLHEGHEEERVSTELTENTENTEKIRVFRGHSFFFVFLRTTIRRFLVFCERFRSWPCRMLVSPPGRTASEFIDQR